MKPVRLIFCIAALVLLQGCASMSKDECLAADWRTIGYEDGARGLPAEQIHQHRTDCAKYGVQPNLQAYLAGRDQGLSEFCKPENGYRVGVAGGRYGAVCPPALEGAFLAGYDTGRKLYTLRAALSSVESELHNRHHELDKIKEEIEHKTVAVVDDKTTAKERILLLADIKELSDRKSHVQQEIRGLTLERDQRTADLIAFQNNHPGG